MIIYLWEEDKLSASETPLLNTHYRVTNALHGIRQFETFDTERVPNNIFDTTIDKTPTHALFTQHYISLAC